MWKISKIKKVEKGVVKLNFAWTGNWNLIFWAWSQTLPPIHHSFTIFLFPSSPLCVNIAQSMKDEKIVCLFIRSSSGNVCSNQLTQRTQKQLSHTTKPQCFVWFCLCLFKSFALVAEHNEQESINLLLRSCSQLLANGWFVCQSVSPRVTSGGGWKVCVLPVTERYWWWRWWRQRQRRGGSERQPYWQIHYSQWTR